MAYSLAKERKLPYGFAIVDRYFRFLPGLIGLLALETLWPLMASGPLYTRVGNFITAKCAANGWINFLMVSNWLAALDIVSDSIIQLHSLMTTAIYLHHCSAPVTPTSCP